MNTIRLRDIAQVLNRYKSQFGFLDVFADDVAEIAQEEPIFEKVAADQFHAKTEGASLALQIFRDKNVARFRLVQDNAGIIGGALAGAVAGAAVGGIADSEDRRQAPAGLLLGLLLGGVLGAAAGAVASTPRPPRQVLTLWYDPDAGEWKVYHGPYASWAKEVLRAE